MNDFYINRIIQKTINKEIKWECLLLDKIIYAKENITDNKYLKINIYLENPFMNIIFHDKNGYKSIKEFAGQKVKELINKINDIN